MLFLEGYALSFTHAFSISTTCDISSLDSITTLHEDIFDGLTGLRLLWIWGDVVATLDEDIFEDLTELEELWLAFGVGASLPVDLYDPFSSSLRALELFNIGLTDLPVGIFDGLIGLKKLDLACNSLTELNLDRFDPFSETLTTLDIRGNIFTTPPSETAIRAKLPSLTELLTGPITTCQEERLPEEGLTVSFGAATYTAAEGGNVDVEVTLSADPEGEVIIPITRSNQGGATDGDYSGVPANVTFGVTETSKTFTFSATDDSVDDDDESVLLGFGALPTGVSALGWRTTMVRITDDDDPAVTVSFGQTTYTAAEGSSVTVTVELSADPEREVIIPLTATGQDGATDGPTTPVCRRTSPSAAGRRARRSPSRARTTALTTTASRSSWASARCRRR